MEWNPEIGLCDGEASAVRNGVKFEVETAGRASMGAAGRRRD